MAILSFLRFGKKVRWFTPTPKKIAVVSAGALASAGMYVGYKLGAGLTTLEYAPQQSKKEPKIEYHEEVDSYRRAQ